MEGGTLPLINLAQLWRRLFANFSSILHHCAVASGVTNRGMAGAGISAVDQLALQLLQVDLLGRSEVLQVLLEVLEVDLLLPANGERV